MFNIHVLQPNDEAAEGCVSESHPLCSVLSLSISSSAASRPPLRKSINCMSIILPVTSCSLVAELISGVIEESPWVSAPLPLDTFYTTVYSPIVFISCPVFQYDMPLSAVYH